MARDPGGDERLPADGVRDPTEGVHAADLDDFTSYYGRLQSVARDLPAVVFTLAAQDLPFADLLE